MEDEDIERLPLVDDEDEDVVFQNSALYQHLQDVGYTDFASGPDRSASGNALRNTAAPLWPLAWLEKARTGLISAWTWVVRQISHAGTIKQLKEYYTSEIINAVLAAKCLEDDDRIFLESFAEDVVFPANLPTRPSVFSNKIRFCSILVALCSYCSYRIAYPQSPAHWAVDIAAFLSLGLCIFLPVVDYIWCHREEEKLQENMALIERVVKLKEEGLSLLMKRCIRLIQETELVSRGFTLVSQGTPLTRLEQNMSQRQCPGLRKELFGTAKACLLSFRNMTLGLIRAYPLHPEVDNPSNYMAHIELEEYGPCMTPRRYEDGGEQDEDEAVQEATDNFSLASIKAICHLYNVHSSEFLRRLLLAFLPQAYPTGVTPDVSPASLGDFLSQSTMSLEEYQLSLDRVYHYYKSSIIQEGEQVETPRQERAPTHSLHVAIHSLDLHLQAAIKRVRSLEKKLESVSGEDDLAGDLEECLSTDMLIVKSDLEACTACWEEGLTRIENLFQSESSPIPTPDEIPEGATVLPHRAQQAPIPLFEMGDLVIHDQVFEAYTDPAEKMTSDGGWEPMLSKEEKEKRKGEREEARRMLKELRSVISVKATEHRAREAKALAAMRGELGDAAVDSSPETSDASNLSKDGDRIQGQNQTEIKRLSENTSSNSSSSTQYKNVDSHISGTRHRDDSMKLPSNDKDDSDNSIQSDNEYNPQRLVTAAESADNVVCTGTSGGGDADNSHVTDKILETDEQSAVAGSDIGEREGSNRDLSLRYKGSESESKGDDSCVPLKRAFATKPAYSGENLDSDPDPDQKDYNQIRLGLPLFPRTTGIDDDDDEMEGNLHRSGLEDRLKRVCHANLGFTSNVAAMAVARAQKLNLEVERLGDSSSDDEEK